jgi:restriction endonuclease S subunit
LIATEEHEGLTPSKSIAVLSPKDDNAALVYWLQYWLQSSDFRLKYFDAISRSSVGHLSPSVFWSVEMPEPSSSKLLELEKVTSLLDRSQKDLELTLDKIKKLREVEIDILFAD